MSLSLKGWAILIGSVLLGILILWGCIHLVHVGEDRQKTADDAAVERHDKQVTAQAAKDLKDANDTVTALKGRLAAIALEASQQPLVPTVPVRLCFARSGDQGRPAGAAALPVGSQAVPDRTGDPGVPGGDPAGADVSTDVQNLGLAGEIRAAAGDELWDWALTQARTVVK